MYNYQAFSSFTNSPLFYLLLVTELILKGMALYKSARKGQTWWFIALLLVNSMGLLPLVYLLIQKSLENKSMQVVAAKKTVRKKK